MATWMRVVENHPWLAERKGDIVRRKNGKVEYRVTGVMHVDESYLPHYNFVHNYAVLERVSGGSSSRPPGSQTAVNWYEFQYDFETLRGSA